MGNMIYLDGPYNLSTILFKYALLDKYCNALKANICLDLHGFDHGDQLQMTFSQK